MIQTTQTKKDNQENGNIEHILEVRFGKERVDAWKKQFAPRKFSAIVVEDKVVVLQPLTVSAMSTYSMTVAQGEGLDVAAQRMLDELWIDGDECLRSDEEYFMALMLQVQNAIELKKSAFYLV